VNLKWFLGITSAVYIALALHDLAGTVAKLIVRIMGF